MGVIKCQFATDKSYVQRFFLIRVYMRKMKSFYDNRKEIAMPSIAPNGKSQYGRGLAEGSWKGMKKYLEQEMLCPELKDRIRFHYEVYPRFGGSSAVFSVSLDERRIKAFGLMYALTRLQEQGKLKPGCYIWTIPMNERDEYTDDEFSQALFVYRSQPIQSSVFSDNPLIRMFALLDRRVGKRTLERLKYSINDQPEWLRCLYEARTAALSIGIRRDD